MLKAGIICIAAALGIALFIPREWGGLLACSVLIVLGITLVVASPHHIPRDLYLEDYHDRLQRDELQIPDTGSSRALRRPIESVRDSPLRGRHAAPEAIVADPEESTAESGE